MYVYLGSLPTILEHFWGSNMKSPLFRFLEKISYLPISIFISTVNLKSFCKFFREVFRSFCEVFQSFRKFLRFSRAFQGFRIHSDPLGCMRMHSEAIGSVWTFSNFFEIFESFFNLSGRNFYKRLFTQKNQRCIK